MTNTIRYTEADLPMTARDFLDELYRLRSENEELKKQLAQQAVRLDLLLTAGQDSASPFKHKGMSWHRVQGEISFSEAMMLAPDERRGVVMERWALERHPIVHTVRPGVGVAAAGLRFTAYMLTHPGWEQWL